MYLKYFLESGIFAQDSEDSESRTLFYFVTDPSVVLALREQYPRHQMQQKLID